MKATRPVTKRALSFPDPFVTSRDHDARRVAIPLIVGTNQTGHQRIEHGSRSERASELRCLSSGWLVCLSKTSSLAALLLFLSVFVAVSTSPAVAQVSCTSYPDIAVVNKNGALVAAPFAGVTIGTSSASGIPLTPKATIYTDNTCSVVSAVNPFNADANGNYVAYMKPGAYQVQTSAANQATYTKWIVAAPNVNGPISFTGPITFSGGVSGISLSGGVNAQTGVSYTFLNSDLGHLVTFTNAGAITATLPQAGVGGFGSSWFVDIQNRGAGLLTINVIVSTIDGGVSLILSPGTGLTIYSDGVNYYTQRGSPGAALVINVPLFNGFYFVDGGSGLGHYPMTNSGIAAALTACGTTGGTLFVGYTPVGAPVIITSTLSIPVNCSFRGSGKAAEGTTKGTVFKAGAAIDVMTVASTNAVGNRGGPISDFTIDGNGGLANRDLNLSLTVGRRFEGIRTIGAKAGVTLENAQNNKFIDCDFENNVGDPVNGAGLRISWGSANNVFVGGEIGANAPYGILFHANAGIDPTTSPGPDTNVPFANQFIKVNVEFPELGQIAFIRMRIGKLNIFDGMDFGAAGGSAPFNVYQSNNDDGIVGLNSFVNNSYVNGDNQVTVLHMQNDFKTKWIAGNVENASKFVVIDDNSILAMDSTSQLSSVTTFFTALGVKTQDQLVLSDILGAQQFERPTTFVGDLNCAADGGCSIGAVNRPNNLFVKNFFTVAGIFNVGSSGSFDGGVGTMTGLHQGSAGQWSGVCTFAASNTCGVVYGVPFVNTPTVFISPISPGAVTMAVTTTNNGGFFITASAPNSLSVNWLSIGNPN